MKLSHVSVLVILVLSLTGCYRESGRSSLYRVKLEVYSMEFCKGHGGVLKEYRTDGVKRAHYMHCLDGTPFTVNGEDVRNYSHLKVAEIMKGARLQ